MVDITSPDVNFYLLMYIILVLVDHWRVEFDRGIRIIAQLCLYTVETQLQKQRRGFRTFEG